MKTISQYREDIAALMKKAADMDAKATVENRDLTDGELSIKNEMMDTVEDYRRTVATLERQQRIADALEKPEAVQSIEKKREIAAQTERDRFPSFGAQLAAVMRAGQPGGVVDPRLRITSSASGLNETIPSDGGFLVQQDFSTELLKDVFETGILASRCRRVPISGNANSMKLPGLDETSRASTRWGGIVGYWEEEAGEKSASKPKF